MRKILFLSLTMLLAISPVFAQDSDISEKRDLSEVVLKFGVAPAGQINTKDKLTGGSIVSFDGAQAADNVGLYLSGEYYIYPWSFFGIGAGVNYQFERHIKHFGDMSAANLYLSIKPKISVGKTVTGKKEYVYLLLQGGYGLLNSDYKVKFNDIEIPASTESGLYYAGGVGFEWSNIIFELLFCVNESKIKGKDGYTGTMDATYTTTNLNIGYRFGF